MTNLTKYGFSLIREKELREISATLYEMEHVKTGANLVYLERDDENKTFAIGSVGVGEEITIGSLTLTASRSEQE
jgi:hypothetical protein